MPIPKTIPPLSLVLLSLSLTPLVPAAPAVPVLTFAALPLAQVSPSPSKPRITPKPNPGAAKGQPAAEPKKGATDTDATTEAAKQDAAAGDESFVSSMVRFIKTNAVWILAALGAALAAVVCWALLTGREKPGAAEDAFASLGLEEKPAAKASTRYSSTKIQAADIHDRLARNVKTTEVETDREYALVVDEDALKMPPVPEDPAGSAAMDAAPVRRLLEAKNLQGAFEEYVRQTQAHTRAPFEKDVELQLGEGLLRSRDLDRAARVLERHVATRQRSDVQPETFFNLGYIHFLNKTYARSRKYLDIFVEVEKNPVYVERARKILARLKGSPAKN
jgi:hypothetical protein